MNRWFEIQYDSSTDYADYADEMKPEPTLDEILPLTADPLLLFLTRRGKE